MDIELNYGQIPLNWIRMKPQLPHWIEQFVLIWRLRVKCSSYNQIILNKPTIEFDLERKFINRRTFENKNLSKHTVKQHNQHLSVKQLVSCHYAYFIQFPKSNNWGDTVFLFNS